MSVYHIDNYNNIVLILCICIFLYLLPGICNKYLARGPQLKYELKFKYKFIQPAIEALHYSLNPAINLLNLNVNFCVWCHVKCVGNK